MLKLLPRVWQREGGERKTKRKTYHGYGTLKYGTRQWIVFFVPYEKITPLSFLLIGGLFFSCMFERGHENGLGEIPFRNSGHESSLETFRSIELSKELSDRQFIQAWARNIRSEDRPLFEELLREISDLRKMTDQFATDKPDLIRNAVDFYAKLPLLKMMGINVRNLIPESDIMDPRVRLTLGVRLFDHVSRMDIPLIETAEKILQELQEEKSSGIEKGTHSAQDFVEAFKERLLQWERWVEDNESVPLPAKRSLKIKSKPRPWE